MIPRLPLIGALAVSASLCLTPLPSLAAPPGESSETPVEGPAASSSEPTTSQPAGVLPPPSVVDPPAGIAPGDGPEDEGEDEGESGGSIEFAVPPPELETDEPSDEPVPASISFPDPGMAPTDGNSQLVLGGLTVGLTLAGFGTALAVGLRRGTPLEWLLPSTIVPTVGLLAFGAGGLYVGIERATTYRRWEAGYRVIGSPQGGGLTIGGGFALLGAIGFGSIGGFMLRDGYTELGGSLLAVGIASGIAMPIMFVVGARRARAYERTGGWRRRPVPPLPPGAEGAGLRPSIAPSFTPLRGGFALGASGRF